MKIGVSSYSFTKYYKETKCSYFNICDIAREIGYDGIEFVDLFRLCDCQASDEMKTALEIREHCAKTGLEIVAYTVHGDFLAADLQAELARLRACVDVTAAMGAKIMRHDAAWNPRPIFRYGYKDAIKEIAPHIRDLTEYAQAKGVKTCTENHGRFLQDAVRVKELMDAVNHPNYGWLIDMGNFMGIDADIPESVSIAAPYAFHVHAKDNLYKPGSGVAPEGWRITRGGNFQRSTVVGHGAVPIQQCIKIIGQAGYDAYISVEFEGWEDTVQALKSAYAYLRKIV
jgi:sugar phosphate isomerase/epimerase